MLVPGRDDWRGQNTGALRARQMRQILLRQTSDLDDLLSFLFKSVGLGGQVCEGICSAGVRSGLRRSRKGPTESNILQHSDSSLHVAEVEGIVEPRHVVTPHLGNLGHLLELLRIAGDEVQEGETVKVLGPLVRDLDDLLTRYQSQCAPAKTNGAPCGCLA